MKLLHSSPTHPNAAAQAAPAAVRAQQAGSRHRKGQGSSGGAQAPPAVGQLGACWTGRAAGTSRR